MANKVAKLTLVAVVAVAVLLVEPPKIAEAVTCDPSGLSPCAGALFSGQAPSSGCCAKLRAQKPCLCQYYKDPSFSQYIKSPDAKRVLATCGVSVSC